MTIIVSSEVLAHISTRSPYHDGVTEKDWATISNAIFFLSQLLGWAYLTAVLQVQRRWRFWMNIAVALLAQVGLALILFLPSMIILSFGAREPHISYFGYELLTVVRPELVSARLWLNAITFAIGWGLSVLLLLTVRGMHRRWLAALFHVLVFHSFTFPVGALLGLMYVLYLWQLVPDKPPR